MSEKEQIANTPPTFWARHYPKYVLLVLVLTIILSLMDRMILSILNEHIKHDLGATDAQMGFLFGTAFAIFYSVMGIPLGRLADTWVRRSVIALGVLFWSVMTMWSGLARSYTHLAIARVGVAVGETSAAPAAISMLSDYFPVSQRSTAMGVLLSGATIGGGLSLVLGSMLVEWWDATYPAGSGPLGIAGWQFCFIAIGFPGLLVAAWVRSLREPIRGQADGIYSQQSFTPAREFMESLGAVLPPLTLWHIKKIGGMPALLRNMALATIIAIVAALIIRVSGDLLQWLCIAIGVYALSSWAQSIAMRDPPVASLIFHTPSLRWLAIGCSLLQFSGYAIGFWFAPFLIRVHGAPLAEVGLMTGSLHIAGGILGMVCGGMLSDYARRRSIRGRFYVIIGSAMGSLPILAWLLTTNNLMTAYLLRFPADILMFLWHGSAIAIAQEFLLPRMRGVGTAVLLLLYALIGMSLGPYFVGKVSDISGNLALAMSMCIGISFVASLMVAGALRHVKADSDNLIARARSAGEDNLTTAQAS